MSRCIDCEVDISKYNEDIRCYSHREAHAALNRYTIQYEIKKIGLERWSQGQTNKKSARISYIKELAKHGAIGWDSLLTEIALTEDVGSKVQELFKTKITDNELAYIDENLGELSREHALFINELYPESNILTRWHYARIGESYVRFQNSN